MKKQAFNPYLPSYEYIPDGEPYVFGDRVYVYGSHDAFDGKEYCVNNYVCWSAPVDDLGNWETSGIIYDKRQDPMCGDDESMMMYAPDVQQGPDGRFYLYYFFNVQNVIAVAVCDKPDGKYEFYGYVHHEDGQYLGQREGDPFQFDPGVLVEGNDVWLYTGFCPPFPGHPAHDHPIIGPMVTKLAPDMLTIVQEFRSIGPCYKNSQGTGYEGHEFFEASSMRKVGERYYFIYSSINGHELCYATSDYPDRDFVFGGTIVSNADIFLEGRTREQARNYYGNNHGSIVQIGQQWYIFYHRQTNRIQFSRQACAEKITIEPDGRIPQVEITSCGLNDGPLCGEGEYEARIACNLWSREGAIGYGMGGQELDKVHPYFTQDGPDREDNPNQHIANMNEGAVAGFKYFQIESLQSIAVTVRGAGKAVMEVYTDLAKLPIAAIDLKNSADWQTFGASVNWTKDTVLPEKTALYFCYRGEGAYDFLNFTLG